MRVLWWMFDGFVSTLATGCVCEPVVVCWVRRGRVDLGVWWSEVAVEYYFWYE